MPISPSTLLAWRELEVGEASLAAWSQFKTFFEDNGYRLFVPDPSLTGAEASEYLVQPPGCSRVRTEDEYGRFLPECLQMKPTGSLFHPTSGIHIAARSPQNTDVIIRIIAIGDEGKEHLAIMRALAAPDAQVPENRTVPMLNELQTDDVVFGIFPFMRDEAMFQPWFKTLREALDALEQIMEGFVFLHERLIAHRDFAFHEVFMNYGCDWDFERDVTHCYRIPPTFRSVCPDLRYFINDFELSAQFAPDSNPQSRLVSDHPTARYGYSAETYNKPLAPEVLSDAPHCPFKADIYQFGWSGFVFFKFVDNVPELLELFAQSGDPDARPTAAQALATLRAIRQTRSEDELNDFPNDSTLIIRHLLPGETCTCSLCTPPTFLPPIDLNSLTQMHQAMLASKRLLVT